MNRPSIGVGVLAFRGSQILLAERLVSHGAATWGSPGGHLEFGESFSACASREIEEEARLHVLRVELLFLSNIVMPGQRHYLHIGLAAEVCSECLPVDTEPEKQGPWTWFDVLSDRLPEPMFSTTALAVDYKFDTSLAPADLTELDHLDLRGKQVT